jgi:hypothetical protein
MEQSEPVLPVVLKIITGESSGFVLKKILTGT